ncbi:histone deacetylase 5 [Nymphaea colorata]|nr:histone deacetylase 5 [Nymphaea colorata]XP_049934540.1 histone deacetylase 5 [Nymphaea colorata]
MDSCGGKKGPVGLAYDERMCAHFDPREDPHPEDPQRIKAVWEMLQSEGIPERCVVMKAKSADEKNIALVHSQKHVDFIRTISSKGLDAKRGKIASRFNSIYFNKGSSEAAFLAAGSVLELTEKVAKGELGAAVAIVRPPGHHAEHNEPMGFCLFNNVAIAANFLVNEKPELGIKKILIVDWDVHHGNGTQKMFWNDPRVLYFSVHRYDNGSFYPGGDDGAYNKVGEGLGTGYNVNVPWEHGRCGDADYLAVWDNILIPLAKSFDPDLVLISAGFDAAIGDPLGGCRVTPYGYSIMTKKLMDFASGKIVLALEGGYNLNSLAKSVLACVKVLLEDKPIDGSFEAYPFESTWRIIKVVRQELRRFWPIFSEELPQAQLINIDSARVPELISASSSESDSEDNAESDVTKDISQAKTADTHHANVVLAFSKLEIDETKCNKGVASNNSQTIVPGISAEVTVPLPAQIAETTSSWRSAFSKVDVWYASYGSNMWKPRFLCYIEGGQVQDMQRPCVGSNDRRPPKNVMWTTVPHRLFFGHSRTSTWGAGGVAFLHPESNSNNKAHICLYKITLEQFNDVLVQENRAIYAGNLPVVDLALVDYVAANKSVALQPLKEGWYHNVIFLGVQDDLPILSMTCPMSDIDRFKSGELPLSLPAAGYKSCLIRGLVEGKQLCQQDAVAYLDSAATFPL